MIFTPELLKTRLHKAKVQRVVVIDDAFDEPRLMNLVAGPGVDEFWEAIQDIEGAQASLIHQGIPCSGKQQLEEDGLLPLWRARKSFNGELEVEIRKLFSTPEQKWGQPTLVAENLKTLGLDVESWPNFQIPGEGEPNPLQDVQVVFLDYDLEGADAAPEFNTDSLSHKIATYLGDCRGESPFLVLFSSLDQVEQHAEQFRETALYLRGSFLFLKKSDAVDLSVLCSRLASSCIWSRDVGHFRHFFITLRNRLHEVSREVEKKFLQLDVQDYAHFQRVVLQEDGAPLGRYVLDLFGAVLSHEFRNGEMVQQARAVLDKLDLTSQHLPFHTQPTASMEQIYRAVLTEPGITPGYAGPHPAASGVLRNIGGYSHEMPPLLMLGDIFVKNKDQPAFIVMNSACDMQYSERGRDPKWDLSIMLVAGKLEALDVPFNQPKHSERMRWLKFEGSNYRVLWDMLSVTTLTLGKFDKWQKDNGYKRIARMSLPYSLALKQSWLSNLSRVGLPTSPPIHDVYDIEVFTASADGKEWEYKEMQRGAAIVSTYPADTGDKEKFSLTLSGRDLLLATLSDVATLATGAKKDAAEVAIKDTESWFGLVSEYFSFSSFSGLAGYKFPKGQKPAILFEKGVSPDTHILNDKSGKTLSVVAVLSPSGSVPSRQSP